MISLLAPLLLAKAAAAEPPVPGLPIDYPATLQAPLTDARRFMGFFENCSARSKPPLALRRQFDQLSDRLGNDIARDRGVWGVQVKGHDLKANGVEVFWSDQSPPAYAACNAKTLAQSIAKAKDAIAAYEAAYTATTSGLAKGLWIGPLKACKASVTKSLITTSNGMTALSVNFGKASAKALKAVSTNSLRLPLDIRLDGKLIMQPLLGDPLDSGGLQVTSPDQAMLARAKAAVEGPC